MFTYKLTIIIFNCCLLVIVTAKPTIISQKSNKITSDESIRLTRSINEKVPLELYIETVEHSLIHSADNLIISSSSHPPSIAQQHKKLHKREIDLETVQPIVNSHDLKLLSTIAFDETHNNNNHDNNNNNNSIKDNKINPSPPIDDTITAKNSPNPISIIYTEKTSGLIPTDTNVHLQQQHITVFTTNSGAFATIPAININNNDNKTLIDDHVNDQQETDKHDSTSTTNVDDVTKSNIENSDISIKPNESIDKSKNIDDIKLETNSDKKFEENVKVVNQLSSSNIEKSNVQEKVISTDDSNATKKESIAVEKKETDKVVIPNNTSDKEKKKESSTMVGDKKDNEKIIINEKKESNVEDTKKEVGHKETIKELKEVTQKLREKIAEVEAEPIILSQRF